MAQQQSITTTVATYDAIHAAISTKSALDVIYATAGVEAKARTIRPVAIEVGKKGSDLIVCDDSLRNTRITLRVDRLIAISGAVAERY
ncbi:MAG: WYL domain-containing protein [Chloroflexota bacterium]|nr:WYL domain-containing protein [Chloroflexota bacterium]